MYETCDTSDPNFVCSFIWEKTKKSCINQLLHGNPSVLMHIVKLHLCHFYAPLQHHFVYLLTQLPFLRFAHNFSPGGGLTGGRGTVASMPSAQRSGPARSSPLSVDPTGFEEVNELNKLLQYSILLFIVFNLSKQ